MDKIYITADLHFGHEELCLGLRNMTARENDDRIITLFNKILDEDDQLIILGDVSDAHRGYAIDCLEELKCQDITIVLGNHDDMDSIERFINSGYNVAHSIVIDDYIMTHLPVHPFELQYFKGNIHGHIHQPGVINGHEYSPAMITDPRYFNANVEFCDYMPVDFEFIKKNDKTS